MSNSSLFSGFSFFFGINAPGLAAEMWASDEKASKWKFVFYGFRKNIPDTIEYDYFLSGASTVPYSKNESLFVKVQDIEVHSETARRAWRYYVERLFSGVPAGQLVYSPITERSWVLGLNAASLSPVQNVVGDGSWE